MTLKDYFEMAFFGVETLGFWHIYATLLPPYLHYITKICKPLLVYWFLMHGIITGGKQLNELQKEVSVLFQRHILELSR